jgi:hypothetical protein
MKLPALLIAAALAATAAQAQTGQSFHGTISNLGTEPAPYVQPSPPPVVEAQPDGARKPFAAPFVASVPPSGAPAIASQNWRPTGQLPPLPPPTIASMRAQAQAQASIPPPPKMTKREKWLRAAQIFNAVAGAAYVGTRCYQVETKPLVRYTGADYNDLRVCQANGY